MVTDGGVVLRRTWPQRFVLLASVGVIAGALVAAWTVQTLYDGLVEVGRVPIGSDVLSTDTAPGEPVNILLVGTDSADGIDPDDPIHIGREVDPQGRHNADSISVLRLDPRSGQAWVMSIPRDLFVDVPDGPPSRINATLLTGGPSLLIRTIGETFDIEINHYVVLDFLAFREVVDKLGGVPVWFEHQTRSRRSGLEILTPGCNVLDGTAALQYVRARTDYQEFIDGDWTRTASSDFDRIERQQDFLVLTIDRAFQRGARSPRVLASLVEAAARSVELDQAITIAEIADLGTSFTSFDGESLARFTPRVTTEYTRDGTYIGEVLIPEENEELFAIFKGKADGLLRTDVGFDIVASSEIDLQNDADLLAGLGFVVGDVSLLDEPVDDSVVVHPPGERGAAVLVARHLIPIPAVVEVDDAEGLTLVLGTEHEQVAWLTGHRYDEAIEVIEERGDVDVPDLAASRPSVADGFDDPTATVDPDASTTVTSSTTTTVPATTTTTRITGRPPEGVTCS